MNSKYLKYAIGEILLVVVGILIALQVNNWNEVRKEKALEENYLINLIEDIERDSIQLNNLFERVQNREETKIPYLEMLELKNGHPDTLLSYYTTNSVLLLGFVPLNATFQELTNSGDLSIIRNKALKESIVNYYAGINNLEILEQTTEIIEIDRLRFLRSRLSNMADPKIEEVYALADDYEYLNSIRINFNRTRMRNYSRNLSACQTILNDIRKELK